MDHRKKMLVASAPVSLASSAARRLLLAGGAARPRAYLAWAGVAAALLLQLALFRQYALREVVWAYPASHDQTYYLTIAYDTYEHILHDGLKDGVIWGLRLPSPTGMLLHVQAAVLSLFVGPGRLSALTVNFLYFALLQVILVGTVQRLSGRWSVALLAWGLLLGTLSPFAYSGALMDFRLDFATACMFGILACLALRSGLFASRPWSIGVGLATAYMVLLRFLTVVYLGGVVVLFAVFLSVRGWRQRDGLLRQLDRRRLANLGLAIAVASVFILPGLWIHRRAWWGYYVVGHVTGKEAAIRMAMDGHELVYYPRSLVIQHLGPFFLKLALLGLFTAGLLASGWAARRASDNRWHLAIIAAVALAALVFLVGTHLDWAGPWFWAGSSAVAAVALAIGLWRQRGGDPDPFLPGLPAFVLLVLLLGIPLVCLTLDLHRSPVVGGIVLAPVLLLAVLPLMAWSRRTRTVPGSAGAFAATALGAVGIIAGGFFHLSAYASHWRMTMQQGDNERLLELHDTIARIVIRDNIRRPMVSVTSLTDYLPHRISAVLMYERHGVQRTFEAQLGGFLDVPEEEVFTLLDASDFILLSPPLSALTPFEKQMAALLPKVRAYCDEHFVYVGTYRFFGDEVRLYTRAVHVECKETGWVPGEEMTVSVPGRVLRGRSMTLRGGQWASVPEGLHIRAHLAVDGRSVEVPASLVVHGTSSYEVRIDSKGVAIPAEKDITIRLSFAEGAAQAPPFVIPPPDRVNLTR
jgi:hypothetical protein